MTGTRHTGTVVVGAGQAGLALSRFLGDAGHPHVLLDRGRIGERWRSERWDSLALLTPAWLSRLPGQAAHGDADAFLAVPEFVAGLESYASSFDAPVLEGTRVLAVEGGPAGFRVTTDRGDWAAGNVVVATGDSADPLLPAAAADVPRDVRSLHSSGYRSPDHLAPGGVLVVGAGPSGQQLALELARAGREVTIAVGRHARMPRRYRGRDIWHWLVALGHVSQRREEIADLDAVRRNPSLPLSGTNGGEQLDLGILDRAGVRVAGRVLGFSGRHALLGDDLESEVSAAAVGMQRILGRIDEFVERSGIDAPAEEISQLELPPAPSSLDLRRAGVTTVIWATGYRRSYPWLRVPVLDENGEIVQRSGVTAASGLYTLGLKLQRTRSSHTISGVGADAEVLAQRIVASRAAPQGLRAA
jgi:putative flavoprotein involved in K+ transport